MRRTLVTAVALALAGTGSAFAMQASAGASAVAAPEVKNATTQLPRSVRPAHYDIAVVPHADSLAFNGHVAIALDVLEPTTSITLNAADMVFSNATLTASRGKPQVRRRRRQLGQ